MKERTRLLSLCIHGMEAKGINDEAHKERLRKEIKAIDEQSEHDYLLALHDEFKEAGKMFPENEHNNLVDYALGLAPTFDIEKESAYVQGESPDIDIDYIKEVRNYLSNTWAAETFGQENICLIGTYGTSGIKGAIQDNARVHGEDVFTIQSITTKMEDKDDEGELLEWDKALEMYPDFADYCNRHPEIAASAKLLQGRNRQGGVHAGGLIISNQPIDGFVPLEVRKVNKDNPNGVICSAWTEGQATQDLQPVGLIKFDLLVINNLMQIALACHLVKKRHGLESINALPGKWDWSDTAYLNDPKLIDMANRGDLKCIFQFDGDGMRKLVKRGGVTSFEDLPAYSALYRPGPLNMGMDARYCKRKKREEPYSIHPLLKPILGRTYGVMAYQEQVQKILSVVGKIPDMHTEKIRKAISKKKSEIFGKYKEMFIENGQETLGVNKEFVERQWEEIESFAEYGFNKSHSVAYAYISARLLWLKAHYPLEFYAAVLQNEKDTDKFHDYKLDAKNHGVDVCPVSINKSKENFWIEDEKIYFGFENIKGIGSSVAPQIVAGQPYKDFSDFMTRFGTDARILKPLIALGVFNELEPDFDREDLRKYHEYSKDKFTKRNQRRQRFEKGLSEKDDQLRELLLTEIDEKDVDFELMAKYTPEAEDLWEERFSETNREVPYKYKGEDRVREVSLCKLLKDMSSKREKSIRGFEEKEKFDEDNPLTLDRFSIPVKLDDEELEVLKDTMTVDGHLTYPKAESLYYGFQWNHVLETSPDFDEKFTIDNFLSSVEIEKNIASAAIQVLITAVKKRKSKKGTDFWTVSVEDKNAKRMNLNVWSEDYIRWQEELVAGAMVQLKVSPPGGGFNTLTLKGLSRQERKSLSKENDYRVVPMYKPKKIEEKEEELSTFTFDEAAFEGLQ